MPQGRRAARTAFLCFCILLLGRANAQETIPDLEQKLRANPGDESALMNLGKAYHDIAAGGDASAIEKGIQCFERLLALDSANAAALAYDGSLWTLRARESWWPPNKLRYYRRGSDDLDKAVELEPGNLMVRLMRGMNSLTLPGSFGRLSTALEDFLTLMKQPDFPGQAPELKAVVFYYAGLAFERADDYDRARELFRKVIAVLPGSDYARRAQGELNDMGS